LENEFKWNDRESGYGESEEDERKGELSINSSLSMTKKLTILLTASTATNLTEDLSFNRRL